MVEQLLEKINLADMGKRARAASHLLAGATTAQKNALIQAIATALEANTPIRRRPQRMSPPKTQKAQKQGEGI